MNLTVTDNIPCTYVPLSAYEWGSIRPLIPSCYGVSLPWNLAVYCIFTGFYTITVWTAVMLLIQVFFTFRRWNTMYFW
jgi:hypothetical protein